MQTICTIITEDYLPFAKVLHQSLQRNLHGISLQVLVVNQNNYISSEDFCIHSVDSILHSDVAKGIYKKYAHANPDHFRWALKPVFISFLLQKGFDKVIYADQDLYFVNNFSFLFDELEKNSIILTPHWANVNPMDNKNILFDVLHGGLYNAGFIGANKKGADAINFWAELCHYKIEDNPKLSLFVDQKYLNILPIQFHNVKILRHQGCNLASWNIDTCIREVIDGKIVINKIFEPVFIHFNSETIANILNGNDRILKPFLDEYILSLKNEGIDLYDKKSFDYADYKSPLIRIKHKLLLRTRLKRFLFKLAKRL